MRRPLSLWIIVSLAAAAAEAAPRRTRKKAKAAAKVETRKEEKKSVVGGVPLDEQPAVRRRHELREGRFELGLGTGFTLGQPFRNSFLFNLKGEYHLSDWLSFGAVLGFGVAATDTGLTSEMKKRNDFEGRNCDQVNPDSNNDRDTPQANDDCPVRLINEQDGAHWEDALNEAAWRLSLRGVVTPFSGKMALFSRLFWSYDFYGFAGPGFIGLKNNTEGDVDLGNDGTRPGLDFGAGMHVFFNESLALNIEYSGLAFMANNPSGRNVDLLADGRDTVNGEDQRTSVYQTMMVGVTAFLPFQARRSR